MSKEKNKKRRREEIDSNVIVINDNDDDDEIDGNSVDVDTTLHDDDNNKRNDHGDTENSTDTTTHTSTSEINNTTVENNDMTKVSDVDTTTSSSIIQSPKTFVTWNCNGFISRCTWDHDKLVRLVNETNYPDIICMQEVRLKCSKTATNHMQRNIPCNDDYKHVKSILNDKLVFGNYNLQQFSLANTRYAGTLTLFHDRLNISQVYINNHSAYTFYSAITLLQSYYTISFDQLIQIVQNLQSNTEVEFDHQNNNTSATTAVSNKFLEPSTLTSSILNGSSESKSTVNRSINATRKSQKQQPQQTSINSFFTKVSKSDTNTKKQTPKKQQTKIQSFFTKTTTTKNKVSSVESLASESLPSSLSTATTRTTTTVESSTCIQEHTEHGRFQFFILPTIDFINTYVPNNGNKLESYQRREIWDNDMYNFLLLRQSIIVLHQEQQQQQLSSSSSSSTTSTSNASRPLLWCGDLNCAREYRDGTHWSPIKKYPNRKDTISESTTKSSTNGNNTTTTIVATAATSTDTYYEWWTDETKCFVIPPRRDKKTFSMDNYGMPSFTIGERRRFNNIIFKFNFIDIWRHLYPRGTGEGDENKKDNDKNCNDNRTITNNAEEYADNNSSKQNTIVHSNYNSSLHPWDRPDYTWRGHLSVEKSIKGGISATNNNVMAKYEGKGQRIDYFLMTGCLCNTCSALNDTNNSDMMSVNGDTHNYDASTACIMSIVERCEILGYGSNRDGLFCGSDHCASILQLKENWFSDKVESR